MKMRVLVPHMAPKRIAEGLSFLRRGSGIMAFMFPALLVAASVVWGFSGHPPASGPSKASNTSAHARRTGILPTTVEPLSPTATLNSAASVCQIAAPQDNKGNPSPFIAWLYTQCEAYKPGDPGTIAESLQASQGGQNDPFNWLLCHYANQQVSSGHASWLDKMTATNCEVKFPSPVTGISKMIGQPPVSYGVHANTIYDGGPVGGANSVVVWAGTAIQPSTGEVVGPPSMPTGAVVEGMGPAAGARATVPGSGALTLTAVLSSTSLQLKGQNGETYTFDITTGTITTG